MGKEARMIEFSGVNKWFGSLHVLNDISLTVGKGEVVVVCGPSGSGKSTLIRCVNGLEPFQQGRLVVDGTDLSNRRALRALRMEVGFVFQSFNLYPHKTALENVTLAPIHVRGLNRTEAEARGRALLEKVGLGDKMGNYPHQLSGGQQQLVEIARPLCMQPGSRRADTWWCGCRTGARRCASSSPSATSAPFMCRSTPPIAGRCWPMSWRTPVRG